MAFDVYSDSMTLYSSLLFSIITITSTPSTGFLLCSHNYWSQPEALLHTYTEILINGNLAWSKIWTTKIWRFWEPLFNHRNHFWDRGKHICMSFVLWNKSLTSPPQPSTMRPYRNATQLQLCFQNEQAPHLTRFYMALWQHIGKPGTCCNPTHCWKLCWLSFIIINIHRLHPKSVLQNLEPPYTNAHAAHHLEINLYLPLMSPLNLPNHTLWTQDPFIIDCSELILKIQSSVMTPIPSIWIGF